MSSMNAIPQNRDLASKVLFELDEHDEALLSGDDESESPSPTRAAPFALDVAAHSRMKESRVSSDSLSLLGNADDLALKTWNQSNDARASLVNILSGMYALMLVIVAFAFEVSALTTANSTTPETYQPFYIFLYTVGLLFLFYCHRFLLRAKAYSCCGVQRCRGLPFHRSESSENGEVVAKCSNNIEDESAASVPRFATAELGDAVMSRKRKVSHSAPSAGSMYLRLGAIVFGIVGVLLHGLWIVTLAEDFERGCGLNFLNILTSSLAIIFIFSQLYFIFENSKLVIHRFRNIGRFGTMHLVATNLCIWIRSVVVEEFHTMQEISHQQKNNNPHNSAVAKEHYSGHVTAVVSPVTQAPETIRHALTVLLAVPINETSVEEQLANGTVVKSVDCIQESEMTRFVELAKPFMTTCLIEYSIICAAIMYILWHNIDAKSLLRGSFKKYRKQAIRVDCSSSSKGLFLGLLFVVFTIISMAIFFLKIHIEEDTHALWVLYISDVVLYFVSTFACIAGMYRMRDLKYRVQKQSILQLDDILLMVALVGQVTYCIFSMTGAQRSSMISFMCVIVNSMRLVQVLVQTLFILAGQRLVAVGPEQQLKKPGRELVTFILMVNIALWLINTFETTKASSNPVMVSFYGHGPWTIIVHSTVPLCIFYRFHSSVCFAEIWKNVYRVAK